MSQQPFDLIHSDV
jgi:hypothetical protein